MNATVENPRPEAVQSTPFTDGEERQCRCHPVHQHSPQLMSIAPYPQRYLKSVGKGRGPRITKLKQNPSPTTNNQDIGGITNKTRFRNSVTVSYKIKCRVTMQPCGHTSAVVNSCAHIYPHVHHHGESNTSHTMGFV